jgi:spore germination protein GerM
MTVRRRRLLVLALVAGLLAACGVPIDQTAQKIPAKEVPVVLLTPTTDISSSTTSTIQRGNEVPVSIYFIGTAGLVPVERVVRKPATLQAVLDALDAGPTPREISAGIQSALPSNAQLTAEGVTKGVATIQLDSTFSAIGGTQSINALAQIVYSATHLPGIDAVRFEYAGTPIPAEIGNGELAYGPVDRSDYAQLARH